MGSMLRRVVPHLSQEKGVNGGNPAFWLWEGLSISHLQSGALGTHPACLQVTVWRSSGPEDRSVLISGKGHSKLKAVEWLRASLLGPGCPGSNYSFATSQPCGLRQVSAPLWTLVSPSLTWEAWSNGSHLASLMSLPRWSSAPLTSVAPGIGFCSSLLNFLSSLLLIRQQHLQKSIPIWCSQAFPVRCQ